MSGLIRHCLVDLLLLAVVSCFDGWSGGIDEAQPEAGGRRSGMMAVRGTSLYFSVAGKGTAVVLLHAGIADSRMWDDVEPALAVSHTVIRCDLRGFGRSPAGTGPYAQYADVAALLDSLGIRKAHMVGLSFGGRVAVDFALTYPQRVRSLVLGAPAIGGAPSSQELEVFDNQEEALLEKEDLDSAAGLNVRMWVVGPFRRPGDVSPVLMNRVHAMLLQNFSIPRPPSSRPVLLDPPAFARLEEINAPTLVLTGDKDVTAFRVLAALVARRIPGAKRKVFPGAAHLISMEQPEKFTRTVTAWLERVDALR